MDDELAGWEGWREEWRKWKLYALKPAVSAPKGKRGSPNARKKRRRVRVFERDGYRCVKCKSQEDLTLDHIRPRSKGGTDAGSGCNQEKGDRFEEGEAI